MRGTCMLPMRNCYNRKRTRGRRKMSMVHLSSVSKLTKKMAVVISFLGLMSLQIGTPAGAAPAAGCVKVSKTKVVCKPATPTLKVVADYWGYSIYVSLPKTSSPADTYMFSTNAGKSWTTTKFPYFFVPTTATASIPIQVKVKNVAGLSAAKSASGQALVNDTCPQKKNCTNLPLPAAFIKVQSVISLVKGNSLTLPIHSNVTPEFDTTGGCDVDAKTLRLTTTEVGPCEIYAFGYGDGVTSQGFAHGNLIVFVTKAGSNQGSNAVKSNDFACSKPAKLVGKAPQAPYGQIMMVGKTVISLHMGHPANEGGSSVSCFDYSLDNGKTWKFGTGTSGPLTFYVMGLKKATKYSIRVRATNKGGYSPASAAIEFVTKS